MRDERARRINRGRIHGVPLVGRQPAGWNHERSTPQIADFANFLALGHTVCHLHDGTLGVAEEQHVRLGVRQYGAANLVRPVIKMRYTAQARLNGADDDIAAGESFAATLGVDRYRPVGPLVRFTVGGVGIVRADFAVGGVAIDHRIHVAGGDAEEKIRFSQFFEVDRSIPVRLAKNADAKALRFEQTPDQGHAEARMVDVGVAGNENDVARIPAQGVHLGTRHGQEGGWPETMCPELAITEERAGDLLI